jgi:hypothetical protein
VDTAVSCLPHLLDDERRLTGFSGRVLDRHGRRFGGGGLGGVIPIAFVATGTSGFFFLSLHDLLTNNLLTNDLLTNDLLTNDLLTNDLLATASWMRPPVAKSRTRAASRRGYKRHATPTKTAHPVSPVPRAS